MVGTVMYTETPPVEIYNLPLVLAYCILEDVLDALITQGIVKCTSPKIGPRMIASQNHIQWKDYKTVDEGRDKRNQLAHEGKLLPKADCLKFVNAIGDELKAWKIL